MIVFAVVGWKNSGKTTLVERLVSHLAARNYTVATVKHTHDAFLMDRPGTDTDRHRRAGASQVAMVGANGWTVARSGKPPELQDILDHLSGADIVVVEGFKRSDLPKIEVIADPEAECLWRNDARVVTIASDLPDPVCPLPRFPRDDVPALAAIMLEQLKVSV